MTGQIKMSLLILNTVYAHMTQKLGSLEIKPTLQFALTLACSYHIIVF